MSLEQHSIRSSLDESPLEDGCASRSLHTHFSKASVWPHHSLSRLSSSQASYDQPYCPKASVILRISVYVVAAEPNITMRVPTNQKPVFCIMNPPSARMNPLDSTHQDIASRAIYPFRSTSVPQGCNAGRDISSLLCSVKSQVVIDVGQASTVF